MLCYTLMLFNFHCPYKVYVKECQFNKSKIHQGDKCSGSWLGLREDMFFAQRDQSNQKYNFPLESRHRGTKATKACIHYTTGERNVLKRLFWLLKECQRFRFHWGFNTQRTTGSSTTAHISTVQSWPNPEPWLQWPERSQHTTYTNNRGPEESVCKCVDIGER